MFLRLYGGTPASPWRHTGCSSRRAAAAEEVGGERERSWYRVQRLEYQARSLSRVRSGVGSFARIHSTLLLFLSLVSTWSSNARFHVLLCAPMYILNHFSLFAAGDCVIWVLSVGVFLEGEEFARTRSLIPALSYFMLSMRI